MGREKKLFSCALLAAISTAAAFAGGGGVLECYTKVWVNSTCTGSCGGSYTICPGSVKCIKTATGKKTKVNLGVVQVTCQDYIGGTGQCTQNGFQCTGGTPVAGGSTIVTVNADDCTGACP